MVSKLIDLLGRKIHFVREVDRFPDFKIPEGAQGTIVTTDDDLIEVEINIDEEVIDKETEERLKYYEYKLHYYIKEEHSIEEFKKDFIFDD